MSFGSFCLVKNERSWIRPHLYSWLPWVDQMAFWDGNSTDGTLEIIKEIRDTHPFGHKILLKENKDCANLQDDYVRLFNEMIQALDTDYCGFLHADMILDDPGNIKDLGDAIAYYFHLRSFGGEPGGQMYEITKGRAKTWKDIFRRRDPDLGLHYFGFYGAKNEDCYFSKITGNSHVYHNENYEKYPYEVKDSGIKVSHFSDVRPYERRVSRMITCLLNQGYPKDFAEKFSKVHPRVTFKFDREAMEALGLIFKPGASFDFEPVETPEYLKDEVLSNV